jgi:hypothetical protein
MVLPVSLHHHHHVNALNDDATGSAPRPVRLHEIVDRLCESSSGDNVAFNNEWRSGSVPPENVIQHEDNNYRHRHA